MNTIDLHGLTQAGGSSPADSEGMHQAFDEFIAENPAYIKTGILDELRATEFARLDKLGQVYVDYTGGGLYADCQLAQHLAMLKDHVYGNPHSHNPSSLASTEMDEHARRYVLEYFNASPDEYVAIFTPNASGALKLVGEAYPFCPDSRYMLTFDNHNAVNGIREFARSKGATVTYIPVVAPDLRIDGEPLMHQLEKPNRAGNNLFVYPAQSNFSGVQHSLDWIERAQSKGWDVVLDAAAFVPTNRLDLSKYHPDFVPLSFYKMFGYPTGVGCLIARKGALKKLRRPWFSGGTIEVVSVQADKYYFAEGDRAFEDGTINYLNLPAVEIGLQFLAGVGIDTIHDRVVLLTGWFLNKILSLRHSNGTPLVEVYGPRDTTARAGTVALNFHDPDGNVFNFHTVEEQAANLNISLRTGCFCNPGAGEIAFGLTQNDMRECFSNEERNSFEQCIVAVKGKTAGAVRISFGLATNFADVYRVLQFVKSFLDISAR
ncbi:aminotransferase class V-fold PLP-dependent enzyme [Sphingobacteriales bacterium CHB3]|nr:aminotransferase class V-fold PLP-dependent enzyme [Sphingobacteriales bacterium CHB3]